MVERARRCRRTLTTPSPPPPGPLQNGRRRMPISAPQFCSARPISSKSDSTDKIADLLHGANKASRFRILVKEVRFGVEVIRYYAEEGRRVGGSLATVVAAWTSAVWSFPRPVGVVGAISALELPRRHLRLEDRPGLSPRAARWSSNLPHRDASGDRHDRAMFRGRRPTARRVERSAGNGARRRRCFGGSSGRRHDDGHRFGRGRATDDASPARTL